MRKRCQHVLLLLAVLTPLCSCGKGGEQPSRQDGTSAVSAAARAEQQLAEERQARERDQNIALMQLRQEARKSALSHLMAVALGCLAAVLLLLLAREHRLRVVLEAALKWLLRRRNEG